MPEQSRSEDLNKAAEERRLLIAVVLVGAVTLFCYLGTLRSGFVYDDPFLIEVNSLVTGENISVTDILGSRFFAGEGGSSDFYRPLLILLFRAEYILFGPDPIGFHLVNLLAHAGASILLLLVLVRCGVSVVPAAGAALLFSVHPVQTESVAWISGGANVLAFLFICAALWFYLAFLGRRNGELKGEAPAWSSLCLGIVLLLAALLFKESAFVLLIVVALLATSRPGSGRTTAWSLTTLAAVLLVYFVLRIAAGGYGGGEGLFYGRGSSSERMATFLSLVPQYLGLLVYPHDLNIARPVELAASPWTWSAAAGGLVLVAAAALLVWSWKKGKRAPLIGSGLFLFSLLFVSTLVPMAYGFREMDFPFFERHLYTASAGLAVLAASFASFLVARWRRLAWPLVALCLAGLVLLGGRTRERCLDWQSDLALFEKGVALYPGSPTLHFNLGTALQEAGRHKEAIATFGKARSLDPALNMAGINEAISHYELGERARAESMLRGILGDDPEDCQALDALGYILVKRGDLEGALPLFAAAYRLSGSADLFARNLGMLLADLRALCEALYLDGKHDRAMELAGSAIAELPRNPAVAWAYELRGILLADKGEDEEAFLAFYTAVNLSRDSLIAASRLKEIYRSRGMEAEAIEMEIFISEGMDRIGKEAKE